jgi:hypothetical protein
MKFLPFAFLLLAASSALADSDWEHNGSTMHLSAQGKQRAIAYLKPRASLPASSGTVLFRGRIKGDIYQGEAFLFSSKCDSIGFAVSGPATNQLIQLTGKKPKRDRNCKIVGYEPERLTFNRLGRTAAKESKQGRVIEEEGTESGKLTEANTQSGTSGLRLADAQSNDASENPCVKLGVAVFSKKPSAELTPLRDACGRDPNDCPPTKIILSLGENPFPLNCVAADKLRLAKERDEEQARIAQEAPYDLSADDISRVQTALIECWGDDIGLPDGKLGRKTKAAIAQYTSEEPLNKERFDSLVAGCPDVKYSFAAASIGTDGEYSAVFGYNSGVDALRASIEGCRNKSAHPDSCISMLAPTKTAGFHWVEQGLGDKKPKVGIAIAECNRGQRKHVFLTRGPFKETAKAYSYDEFAAKGYKRSECRILASLDAFGIDE